jgi:hypothetical protein
VESKYFSIEIAYQTLEKKCIEVTKDYNQSQAFIREQESKLIQLDKALQRAETRGLSLESELGLLEQAQTNLKVDFEQSGLKN